MPSKRTITGLSMRTPLTLRQERVLEILEREELILFALSDEINPGTVVDMDSDRIAEACRTARYIGQVRCAVLRTILIEEEQRKPAA